MSKYYEFKYGTSICDVNMKDIEEVQSVLRELDLKAVHAKEDPDSIKRSPFLTTIDLVVKELSERQTKGYLGYNYSAL